MFRLGESFSGHVFQSDVSDRPPEIHLTVKAWEKAVELLDHENDRMF